MSNKKNNKIITPLILIVVFFVILVSFLGIISSGYLDLRPVKVSDHSPETGDKETGDKIEDKIKVDFFDQKKVKNLKKNSFAPKNFSEENKNPFKTLEEE